MSESGSCAAKCSRKCFGESVLASDSNAQAVWDRIAPLERSGRALVSGLIDDRKSAARSDLGRSHYI